MSEKHESKNEESATMDTTPDTTATQNKVASSEKQGINLDDSSAHIATNNDDITEPASPSASLTDETPTEPETLTSMEADKKSVEGGPTKDVKKDAQEAIKQLNTIEDHTSDTGTERINMADVGNTTNDLQQEAIKAMAMKAEAERLEREKAAEDAKRAVFAESMMLRLDAIDTSDGGAPIILEVSGDLTVGRADNVTDYSPEIDLTPHGAYRLGLSRRHALIRRNDEGLLVKDLSSRNGTFVNGDQVEAGKTHAIRDGDEIRFGNLAMRVSFQQKS